MLHHDAVVKMIEVCGVMVSPVAEVTSIGLLLCGMD